MSSFSPNLRKQIFILCNPSSKGIVAKTFDVLLLILITLNVIAVTLETVESIYIQYRLPFQYFEWFSVGVFTIEYLLRIYSAVEDEMFKGQKNTIARIKYAIKPMSIIDLLAILPFYLSFILAIDLRFIRVLRLLRILKITRYSSAMQLLLIVLKKEMQSFAAALFILLTLMILAASGIYLVEQEAQPEVFSSIPESLWWAVVTLSTVGYGDMYPITPLGKFFGAIITIIGVGMVALPAGIIASGFSEELHNSKESYKKSLEKALEDGIIDSDEEKMLEEIRVKLGLSEEDASLILKNYKDKVINNKSIKCPHCEQKIYF